MEKRIYKILNNIVSLCIADDSVIPDEFQQFVAWDTEADVVFTCEDEEDAGACYGIRYLSGAGRTIKNAFFNQKDKKQMMYTYETDYSKLLLQLDEECTSEVLAELLMAGFYSYMSLRDTLLMHASAVEHEGNGIVFTAASGVGKTTQAKLWAQYKNARILNGDKVFLKQEDDGIHAWGSPWKGSSPYACNESAKLKAIVVLEQAAENSIQKLNVLESMQYFVPHVFYPCWDEACEQAVLTMLDKVLEETHIYLLKCRPDESAVELLASVIKE